MSDFPLPWLIICADANGLILNVFDMKISKIPILNDFVGESNGFQLKLPQISRNDVKASKPNDQRFIRVKA